MGGFCISGGAHPNKRLYRRVQFLLWGATEDPVSVGQRPTALRTPAPEKHRVRNQVFPALVSARPNDLDQPVRQQLYLRALRTLPGLSVHLGHFLSHEVTMPLAMGPGQRPQYVRVWKTEEKGSDVNLATHLLNDAHLGRFDVAVVVSNDSDLLEPIKIVRELLGKPVGILNPHKNPSRALLPHIDFIKQIRPGVLRVSQFPNALTDRHGTFTKPNGW
jgi:NYN domain